MWPPEALEFLRELEANNDRHRFKVEQTANVELLQVADCTASALGKAVERDEYGNTEPRYLGELRPILYRRGTTPITSYGLKVFPTHACAPGGHLEWLRSY